MQRVMMKQVLFLLLLAIAIVMVMGVVLYTNVKAQELDTNLLQDWDWDDDWDDDWGRGSRASGIFRYNRVEGLYLGVEINRDYWRRNYPRRPFLFGFAGYALKAKELQYQVGLEKGFFDDFRTAFGGEYHRQIDTPDRWIMPPMENTLAAFLIKEDFHDYYLREGGSGYITQNLTRDILVTASYIQDEYDSVERNTHWSLFGGKKRFRKNPEMSVGEVRTVGGSLVVDTRNSAKRTTRGWYVQIEGEYGGKSLGGNFDYDRVLIDVRRYQPLGFGEGLDFRLRVGSARGFVPWQKSFHLGGLSSLRGFGHKEFPNGPMHAGGNRMVLGQIEYRMGSQDLPDEIDWGILEQFNLILFVDAGLVQSVDQDLYLTDGFNELEWSDVKTDIGIALANRSGNVRIQIARRTDRNDKPFVFSFRISRPF